jgi:hypothetical protein
MENLIETIRTALRDDAEPIARRAGLVACRKILAVLEAATDAEPGAATPAAPPPSAPEPVSVMPPAPASRIDPAAVAALVGSLGKLPPEQLLDLAITRLRAALPAGASAPAPPPLRFHLVPVQRVERSK